MRDLHTHTTFSDGKNTAEEMVIAAIAMGLDTIGFSDHSYAPYDEDCCMPKTRIPEYRRTIQALKEKYSDQIQILCGIEQDYYSEVSTEGYDYVIGSVHYIMDKGACIPVDWKPEMLTDAVKRYYGGDIYALIDAYFETVSHVAEKTGADIIGHIDLIQKFNEGDALFDSSHPRYLAASHTAADRLLQSGKIFEINTGAISRGYRTESYPCGELYTYLKDKGARFILSSDSHSAQALCFGFDRFPEYL